MKPKLLLIALVASLLAGCGSGEDMSKADQDKMREAMSPGRKEGAMTPGQKAGFEKWKAQGGAPASAPGGG